MSTKIAYSYVVLRYVHDILTGEFVNVGLVLIAPKQEIIISRTRKTYGRIKNIFPDLDSDSYKMAMGTIERSMKRIQNDLDTQGMFKSDKNAYDYARLTLPIDDSSLQWSPLGTGITSDVQKTFDKLFERFISRYDRITSRRLNDDDVWRPVEAKLKEQNVPIQLAPKVINGSVDSVNFKHAWKNGRWHVYEPLSFDLTDADNIKDKARRMLGNLSAVKVGSVDDIQVHFLVAEPRNAALMPAYSTALDILRTVPFDNAVYQENEIDDFVNNIEDEYRQHIANMHS